MQMRYQVTEQYSGGSDIPCAAFSRVNDARSFIETKIEADKRLKVKVTYRIFEGHQQLEEMNQETQAGTQTSTSQGAQTSSTTSALSPFATSPKPTGMPTSRWANVGKEDKEEKK